MRSRRKIAPGPRHRRLTVLIVFFIVGSVSFKFGKQISHAISGFISAAMTSDQTAESSIPLGKRVLQAVEYHKNGLLDDALLGYEDVLPELTGLLASTLHSNAGAIYMDKGDDSRASHHFELSISADPTYAKAHFNYAVILTSKYDLHMKAKKYCENALKLDPSMYQAHHLLGNILQNLGECEQAKPYFELAEKQALLSADQTATTETNGSKDRSNANEGDDSKLRLSRFDIMNAHTGDIFTMGSLNSESPSVEGHSSVKYQLICISERPLVFRSPGLIKDDEVKHILSRAAGRLQKSFVMGGEVDTSDSASIEKKNEQKGIEENKSYRSSQNTWLHPDDVMRTVQRRLADLTKLPLQLFLQRSEELQVVKYANGGQFKVHHDSSAFNPRLLTALFYLTTVPEQMGGETWFPYAGTRREFDLSVNNAISDALEIRSTSTSTSSSSSTATCTQLSDGTCSDHTDKEQGLLIRPVKGDAILFFNHLPSGTIDAAAVHAGLPMIYHNSETNDAGKLENVEKWIANYWVEQNVEILSR